MSVDGDVPPVEESREIRVPCYVLYHPVGYLQDGLHGAFRYPSAAVEVCISASRRDPEVLEGHDTSSECTFL